MKSMIYDSVTSIRQLLDSGFEMPIYFAGLGPAAPSLPVPTGLQLRAARSNVR